MTDHTLDALATLATLATLADLTDALAALAARYPGTDIPEATIAGYVEDLADLPLAATVAAMTMLRRTSVFFPRVAEIRAAVAELAVGDDTLAETAWTEVQRQVRDVGFRPLPEFRNGELVERRLAWSSPLVAATVESVGWDVICLTSEEDGRFIRDQFVKTYRALRAQGVTRIQRGGGDLVPLGDLLARLAPDASRRTAIEDRHDTERSTE